MIAHDNKKARQMRALGVLCWWVNRPDSLFAFLNVKDKYSTNNIDFKCFYNSTNKNGYNLVYNKNQSALLFSSLFELRMFRSFSDPLP